MTDFPCFVKKKIDCQLVVLTSDEKSVNERLKSTTIAKSKFYKSSEVLWGLSKLMLGGLVDDQIALLAILTKCW